MKFSWQRYAKSEDSASFEYFILKAETEVSLSLLKDFLLVNLLISLLVATVEMLAARASLQSDLLTIAAHSSTV